MYAGSDRKTDIETERETEKERANNKGPFGEEGGWKWNIEIDGMSRAIAQTNEIEYSIKKSGNGKMLVGVMIAIKMKYGCYSVCNEIG